VSPGSGAGTKEGWKTEGGGEEAFHWETKRLKSFERKTGKKGKGGKEWNPYDSNPQARPNTHTKKKKTQKKQKKKKGTQEPPNKQNTHTKNKMSYSRERSRKVSKINWESK